MYTTYHLDSASELDASIIEAIKIAFRNKSIILTIEEQDPINDEIPDWQKELVLERKQYYKENPQEILDWNIAKKKLKIDA